MERRRSITKDITWSLGSLHSSRQAISVIVQRLLRIGISEELDRRDHVRFASSYGRPDTSNNAKLENRLRLRRRPNVVVNGRGRYETIPIITITVFTTYPITILKDLSQGLAWQP